MWGKEKRELKSAIERLEMSVRYLKKELVNTKVLNSYYNPRSAPISLPDLEDQIECIKDFLGIELVVKPASSSESYMRKISTTKSERS